MDFNDYVSISDVVDGSCVDICPTGKYKEYDGELGMWYCEDCNTNCEECTGNCVGEYCEHECTLCATSKTLEEGECVDDCSKSNYESVESNYRYCYPCSTPCEECTSATDCTVCEPGSTPYLHESTCYETCPDGYYPNDEGTECETCNDSCKTCHGLAYNHCDTCYEGKYILYTGTNVVVLNECVTDCGDGYWADGET